MASETFTTADGSVIVLADVPPGHGVCYVCGVVPMRAGRGCEHPGKSACEHLPASILAPCKGKTFEHHIQAEHSGGQWHCLACGTTGDIHEVVERLLPLRYQALMVRSAMAVEPTLLVPSEAPPCLLGQCFGFDLYRVQGIERPMVAISGA